MVRKLLLVVLITSVLGACSQQGGEASSEAISSFEGSFVSVNGPDKLQFDCSDAVKRNNSSSTLEGYLCNVDVTENTTIRTKAGKNLSVDALEKWETSKLNNAKKLKLFFLKRKT